MNANVNKNTGKLLVAVLAMAMIIAGVAVVFGSNVSAGPVFNDEKTEVTVSTSGDLLAAIEGINNGTGEYADVTTIIIADGTYNVTKTDGNYIGSGFVITANDITIRGADGAKPLIYSDYSNSGNGTNNGINQQNTVTISGDNVTLQNLSIANMYTYITVDENKDGTVEDMYYDSYKSIEFTGNGATFSNVDLVNNENGKPAAKDVNGSNMPSNLRVLSATWGGVLMVSGESDHGTVTLKDVTVNNGVINFKWLMKTGSVDMVMDNVVLNVDDADGAGINYGDNPDANVTYTKTDVVINLNSADSRTTSVINQAPAGTKIVINAPVKLTGNTTNNKGVTIVFGPNGSIDEGEFTFTNEGDMGVDNATELGNTIEGSLSIPNASYLVNDITIKEGGSLVIQKDAYLNLMGKTLTVNGTLTIEKGATVIDSLGGGSIKIVGKGIINNEGIIGEGNAVTISSDYGSVTLKNISGIVFATEKKIDGKEVKYVLDVSGKIEAESKDDSTIGFDTATIDGVAKGVLINADTTIDKNVKASGTATVKGGATLTLNGDASGLEVTMLNNSTVIANAAVGSIEALTGKYTTYTPSGDRNMISDEIAGIVTSSVELENVKGITVKVTSKVFDEPDPANANKTISYTEQMMSVSGDLSLIDSKTKTEGTITLAKNVYVLAGETLSFGKTISIETGDYCLITEGKAVIVSESDPGITYKGAMYYVDPEDSSDNTYTYTNFPDAFANIDSAYEKTVTLMGGYEFTGNITIAAGQVVQFEDDATYTIAADATVIVEADGELSESFATGDDKGIKGILTVMDGGDCTPVDGSYEVLSTDAEDNITYSSAQTAIKNATSGTVVDIVDGAILKDAATVASGVTVNVGEDVNLQAKKGLTVAEGGKIVNKGTITVSDKYDFIIAGDVDSLEGTISVAGTESDITVTGTLSVPGKFAESVNINAAVYLNEDHYVYTTVAKAATAVAAMDIAVPIEAVGTFSESGTVTLGEDMELNIIGKQITLGTVVLETGAELTVSKDSKLTASVSGASGVDGSSVDAVVDLSKVGNVVFTETYNSSNTTSFLNAAALDETEKGIIGTMTVSAGTATVSGSIVFDGKDGILVVGASGTITVPEYAQIATKYNSSNDNDAAAVTVEGTMNVDDGTLTIVDKTFVTISGTLNVTGSDNNTLGVFVDGTMTVTGTVAVSDAEDDSGRLSVAGVLIVGDKPEILGTEATGTVTGPVTIVNDNDGSTNQTLDGYVKAYSGADLSGAEINVDPATGESNAVSTAFNINSTLYMTVYTLEDTGIELDDFISPSVDEFELLGLDLDKIDNAITNIGSWYTDAEMTKKVGSTVPDLNKDAAYYYKAFAENVPVSVSVGEGISLYIDDVRYTSYPGYALTVGTHTVYATVDPGFKGDVTISFNGQAVTDGQFTITPEMASATYEGTVTVSATGNITQDSTVVVDGGSSDGLGLTDYLLIILVVLIVIMAIMVAMRLMRS